MCNSPAKLANTWFAPHERVTALTVVIAGQALGAAVGFTLPAAFISDSDDQEDFKAHIATMLQVSALAGIILSSIATIFFKNQPPTPPSPIASRTASTEPGHFKKQIKELFKNANMLKLMCAFGLIQGVFNTLAAILGILSF